MEWEQFNKGVFLVNVLGIVYDSERKKILIGRRENDPHIEKLSWCFPGGRPSYERDLEFYLKHEIKKKTGLEANVEEAIFAKTYPERREFLSIYYLCEPSGGNERPGEKFVDLKWVIPSEVNNYFTTSLHPQLFKFLKQLK